MIAALNVASRSLFCLVFSTFMFPNFFSKDSTARVWVRHGRRWFSHRRCSTSVNVTRSGHVGFMTVQGDNLETKDGGVEVHSRENHSKVLLIPSVVCIYRKGKNGIVIIEKDGGGERDSVGPIRVHVLIEPVMSCIGRVFANSGGPRPSSIAMFPNALIFLSIVRKLSRKQGYDAFSRLSYLQYLLSASQVIV